MIKLVSRCLVIQDAIELDDPGNDPDHRYNSQVRFLFFSIVFIKKMKKKNSKRRLIEVHFFFIKVLTRMGFYWVVIGSI
jgi:hypothetical protein